MIAYFYNRNIKSQKWVEIYLLKSKDIGFYLKKKIKTKTLSQVFNKTHAKFNTKLCNTTYSQALTIATET